MIRLLCTDFDGTIFQEGGVPPIAPKFLQLVQNLQDNGIKWVINTGRDVQEVLSTLEYHHIYAKPDFLSVVERKLYERQGDQYISMEPWNKICMEVHDKLYQRIAPMLPELEDWIIQNYSRSFLYKDNYSPLCIIAHNNPEADVVLQHVQNYFANIPELSIVRNDIYARLAHKDYHKGATLLELERHLSLPPAETCAAGDHYNDLPMLRKEIAHQIITPANAIQPVKDHVRLEGGYVAKLPYSDGVVEGIEHFIDKSL